MGRGSFRSWWPLVAVAGVVGAVGWLLYLLWHARNRDSLSTYGAFVFPVVAAVIGWLVWAWRKGKADRPSRAANSEVLDQAADQLAAAVREQWKMAAEERGLTDADPVRVSWSRPSQPLAGPASAATGSHRFAPLPGLAETEETDLASGQATDLHTLYGGLRSGRLIITGPPGSGKTGSAVLLVLAALRHREQVGGMRPMVPVPVLFTAQGWDPNRQAAISWLVGKLQDTYPQFSGAAGAESAAALLASGRITVILDGLDEIGPDLRPAAVQALSRQATFRLIILSRTSEMAAATSSQGILRGAAAIELNAVRPSDAASYLERTQLDPLPAGWQELVSRIRTSPASHVGKALASPLTITLVRDTYKGEDITELLRFCDALERMPSDQAVEAITGHLLDRVLPAAYGHAPGHRPPPYDLATAQRVLIRIAAQMSREGTRDLQWWRIFTWTPSAQRIVVTVLATWLVTGITSGVAVAIVIGAMYQYTDDIKVGAEIALAFGLPAGFAGWSLHPAGIQPRVIGKLRFRKALRWRNLVAGLTFGVVAVFTVDVGPVAKPAVGLLVGLIVGLGFGLADALTAEPDSSSSLTPVSSWRSTRSYGMLVGLGVGLTAGLSLGVAVGLPTDLGIGLSVSVGIGLAAGFGFGLASSATWHASLASMQVAIRWRTPVHLMKFLNDAQSRNVLRTVGPAYQFRHARLQDRLAAAANSDDSNAVAPAGEATSAPP